MIKTNGFSQIFYTIIIASFFVALITAVYFYQQTKISSLISTPTPLLNYAPQPTSTPTPTPPIVSSDWKTYTNKTYNFSFQYPNDLSPVDTKDQDIINFRKKNDNTPAVSGFFIFIVKDSKNKLLSQLCLEKDPTLDPNILCSADPANFRFNKSNINSIVWEYLQPGSASSVYSQSDLLYSTTKGNYLFIISANNTIDKNILSSILSTFKFSTTSSATFSDWKTYTNDQDKYTLDYPSTWVLDKSSNDPRTPYIKNPTSGYSIPSYYETTTAVNIKKDKKQLKTKYTTFLLTENKIGMDGSTYDEYLVKINQNYYLEFIIPIGRINEETDRPYSLEDISNARQILSTFKFIN
jgi:hypothetical protein